MPVTNRILLILCTLYACKIWSTETSMGLLRLVCAFHFTTITVRSGSRQINKSLLAEWNIVSWDAHRGLVLCFRKHALNCHRMKPALFNVLCEIKEKTGKSCYTLKKKKKKYTREIIFFKTTGYLLDIKCICFSVSCRSCERK